MYMAHEDPCRDDLPLHYAPDRCKSYDFPCYNTKTKKCVNKDSTEDDPDCKDGKIADKLKCNNKWPDFPCYDPRDGQCYNKDGDLLFDPIADAAYTAHNLYHGTCDLIYRLLAGADAPGTSRETRIKTYELINGYWSAFGKELSCHDLVMKGEYVRALPLDNYIETAKKQAVSLSKAISSKLRKQKNKSKSKRKSKRRGSGSGSEKKHTRRRSKK